VQSKQQQPEQQQQQQQQLSASEQAAMAPVVPSNDNAIVIGHADAEHAPGLHQRRQGALEMEQHNNSSPDTTSPDVEAAIGSRPADNKDAGSPAEAADQQQVEQYADVTYGDIAKQFSILGWTAFGGPAAHIGMFERVSSSILRYRVSAVAGL
jgi:hypothetical protein